ncbi:hypothetical protein DM01DRAFT_1339338 [Hesseltinella vesiculosa]|uniref:Uncharacterized protein n=1 Tax=Hesseltinella vesiculosa TaxID=101127 RepID=A0A1X2G7G1_9FUNG|nr:hypothetical protein DM01DRAFT_1339338 [Hesseltinella vesiculosa]
MPLNAVSNKLTKAAESAVSGSINKNTNKAKQVNRPVVQDALAGRVSYFTLRA